MSMADHSYSSKSHPAVDHYKISFTEDKESLNPSKQWMIFKPNQGRVQHLEQKPQQNFLEFYLFYKFYIQNFASCLRTIEIFMSKPSELQQTAQN